jgi:hypothetical protein
MSLSLEHRNKKANDIHEGKWNGLGGKFEALEASSLPTPLIFCQLS